MKRFVFCACFSLLISVAAVAQEHEAKSEARHAAGESHGKSEASSDLWKWANFALLAGGLGFLVYKNAGPFFRGRSIEIRKGIENAAKMKANADERYSSMEQRLANLDQEIASLRRSAGEEAEAEAARLRKETEREAAKIHLQAQRDIESAAKAARQELRAYSAELAVELAKRRIRERITPADQEALLQSLVGDLKRKSVPQPVNI